MIKIDIKGYEDFVNRLGHMVADETTNKAIKISIFELQREAQKRTPVDTGNLRGSYETNFGNLEGELRNTRKYGASVHEGTKPHYAPIKELRPWARRKGISPFAVQKAIAKKGTKGQPWMTNTVNSMENKVNTIFSTEFDKLFQKLSN